VAHRGDPRSATENTVAAFEAALDAGADAVEFDVRLTADGVPVVLHDPRVDRTTDGTGIVRALPLAAVKRLRTPDGHEVPTLEEALVPLSGRAMADVELKNVPGEPDHDPDGAAATVEATVAAIERTRFAGEVLISSFDPGALARVRASAPSLPTGLLAIEQADPFAALEAARHGEHAWALPAAIGLLADPAGVVSAAREAGLLLGTWVVDDPETALRLFDAGVDAVATNDPRAVATARRERHPAT